jgi:hypothetical protein
MFSAALVVAAAVAAFVYGQVDTAARSIQFELRKIGESVYEARSKSGRWPVQVADLEGTEYLGMPHRRALLKDGASSSGNRISRSIPPRTGIGSSPSTTGASSRASGRCGCAGAIYVPSEWTQTKCP